MSVSGDGIPPLSVWDYSLDAFLCESDGAELDQYLAMGMDSTIALTDHEMSPLEEELINNYQMSGLLNEPSEEENSQTADDISVLGGQFRNEVLEKEDILSSDQILNFEGDERLRTCANDLLYHEALHGEKEKALELVQLLLASGRMIGEGQHDQAARLVSKCRNLSCQLGNPIQRLAYYITGALQERIQRQTLVMLYNGAKPVEHFAFNINSKFQKNEFHSLIPYYIRDLPYIRVFQFTSVQAIIEAVGNARKIHIIDLAIRTGSQWAVLMEYLVYRAVSSSFPPLELLKITAVGMNGEELRKCGERLHELARSLAIPLSYIMVEIQNIEEIKEGIFSVKFGEALAVYAPIILRSLLYDPILLYNLLSVIRKLRPRIMMNVEIEAQNNSPCFVNRFSEVLFQNIGHFDLLDVTLPDRNDIRRVKHEELFNGTAIRNMIVCEGKERTVRHVKTDVWNCLFKQAGFREKKFSFQALHQARLLFGEYASGQHYSLEPYRQAIIVRWKETPLIALSAWSALK